MSYVLHRTYHSQHIHFCFLKTLYSSDHRYLYDFKCKLMKSTIPLILRFHITCSWIFLMLHKLMRFGAQYKRKNRYLKDSKRKKKKINHPFFLIMPSNPLLTIMAKYSMLFWCLCISKNNMIFWMVRSSFHFHHKKLNLRTRFLHSFASYNRNAHRKLCLSLKTRQSFIVFQTMRPIIRFQKMVFFSNNRFNNIVIESNSLASPYHLMHINVLSMYACVFLFFCQSSQT